MGVYILKKQNTVTQYITTRTILDSCKETVRRSEAWVARRWWEQEVLDFVESRATAADGGGEGEK